MSFSIRVTSRSFASVACAIVAPAIATAAVGAAIKDDGTHVRHLRTSAGASPGTLAERAFVGIRGRGNR